MSEEFSILAHMAGFSTRATYAYVLCGWRTRSDIPLTGVPTSAHGAESGDSVDVVIQIAAGLSPVAKNGGRGVFDHSAESSLIGIEGIADFQIRAGRQISVWPAAGALILSELTSLVFSDAIVSLAVRIALSVSMAAANGT